MNYFLKKSGKEVVESSEISMEEEGEEEDADEIPVVENSGNSFGAGLVAKSQVKRDTDDEDE